MWLQGFWSKSLPPHPQRAYLCLERMLCSGTTTSHLTALRRGEWFGLHFIAPHHATFWNPVYAQFLLVSMEQVQRVAHSLPSHGRCCI